MVYIGDGLADGSKAVIGYKVGKENTGATVSSSTSSFWSDPTFLPRRLMSDCTSLQICDLLIWTESRHCERIN